MAKFQRISPFFWFDKQAEQAADFYTAIFEDSKILQKVRYTAEAAKVSGMPEGSVMTVSFELAGQPFTALNGGPLFKFNESISMVVHCKTQDEIDSYWSKLSRDGDPKAQQCGWLKDHFGVSWQIVPARMDELMKEPESARKVMAAVLKMKKIDLEALEDAARS